VFDPNKIACLVVAVIDSDHHELTIANAGYIPPLIRRADGRVEFLAEEVSGFPLWIDAEAMYQNVTVPVGHGEIVIFHSDGVTAVINHKEETFCPGFSPTGNRSSP